MQGYWLAMQAAGLPISNALTRPTPLSPASGGAKGRWRRLLALPARQRPTALIVANHEASYGALPALREHSVTMPADLSVVCYEDSQLARWWHPCRHGDRQQRASDGASWPPACCCSASTPPPAVLTSSASSGSGSVLSSEGLAAPCPELPCPELHCPELPCPELDCPDAPSVVAASACVDVERG